MPVLARISGGEETALLDSLEGFRGSRDSNRHSQQLRVFYARPTVINNVESIFPFPALSIMAWNGLRR